MPANPKKDSHPPIDAKALSPDTTTARMAMKIGAVKLRAVTFAIGEIDSAVKNINIAAMLITALAARATQSALCAELQTGSASKVEKEKAKPKMLRKKAI